MFGTDKNAWARVYRGDGVTGSDAFPAETNTSVERSSDKCPIAGAVPTSGDFARVRFIAKKGSGTKARARILLVDRIGSPTAKRSQLMVRRELELQLEFGTKTGVANTDPDTDWSYCDSIAVVSGSEASTRYTLPTDQINNDIAEIQFDQIGAQYLVVSFGPDGVETPVDNIDALIRFY